RTDALVVNGDGLRPRIPQTVHGPLQITVMYEPVPAVLQLYDQAFSPRGFTSGSEFHIRRERVGTAQAGSQLFDLLLQVLGARAALGELILARFDVADQFIAFGYVHRLIASSLHRADGQEPGQHGERAAQHDSGTNARPRFTAVIA